MEPTEAASDLSLNSLESNDSVSLQSKSRGVHKLDVMTSRQFNRLCLVNLLLVVYTLVHVIGLYVACQTVLKGTKVETGLNGEDLKVQNVQSSYLLQGSRLHNRFIWTVFLDLDFHPLRCANNKEQWKAHKRRTSMVRRHGSYNFIKLFLCGADTDVPRPCIACWRRWERLASFQEVSQCA